MGELGGLRVTLLYVKTTYIHSQTHPYTHTHTHTRRHAYTNTHTHTRTHVYIYIYIAYLYWSWSMKLLYGHSLAVYQLWHQLLNNPLVLLTSCHPKMDQLLSQVRHVSSPSDVDFDPQCLAVISKKGTENWWNGWKMLEDLGGCWKFGVWGWSKGMIQESVTRSSTPKSWNCLFPRINLPRYGQPCWG